MGSTRAEAKKKKLAILKLIKENQDILFGLSQKEKPEVWRKVLLKAQSLRLVDSHRKWTYARDHLFGLWKCRTLAKLESYENKKTDGKTITMNEVDEAILEILGEECPDAMKQQKTEKKVDIIEQQNNIELPEKNDIGELEMTIPQSPTSSRSSSKKQPSQFVDIESTNSLKKEILKAKLHMKKLKILKLERQLGLPHSTFTVNLNGVFLHDF